MIDWPTPEPGPGQVRIRTRACGICTTELKMFAGWPRTGFPAIPGHEWSGRVEAVGPNVDPGLVGAACVAENVLSDGGEVGFEHPGGYGEFFLTEAANVYRLPDDFPAPLAALIEPLAVCVRAARRLNALPHEEVLIFGDGPIGLLMLALLRCCGFERVSMVGGSPSRLAQAAGLGAKQGILFSEAGMDTAEGLQQAFGGDFPAVVEASGAESALKSALGLVQKGGRVLVLGDYAEARADFEWNFLLHREIQITGSNASAGAWPEAVRQAVEGDLPLERLVTHRFPAHHFAEAIDLVRRREEGVIKAVLVWEESA